ncbi:MAG: C39 family peptidase, partial [Planctomycetes bacterium]|nr:C39 family peptidase [Planctomycetota bacterium]
MLSFTPFAVGEDGKMIEVMAMASGPAAPVDTSGSIVEVMPQSAVGLGNVPTSRWTQGCSATSAGMIFGYYDRTGYSNMYAGPTNGGVAPLTNLGQGTPVMDGDYPISGSCSIIATANGLDGRATNGHTDDYWISYGSGGPDPWEAGGTEHTWGACTADYMGTNQWKWDYIGGDGVKDFNSDGSTALFSYGDGTKLYDYIPPAGDGLPQTALCHGMRLFANSRGYSLRWDSGVSEYDVYTQATDNQAPGSGFSFADFQAEINAGYPVMVQVTGHTMVGVGYDVQTNMIYVHDTWDNSVHSMTWGTNYVGMDLEAITVLHLDPTADSHDFGDAPNSYSTLLANNGPRHVATGLMLGTVRDTEADAHTPLDGTGDNVTDGTDDEDGVTFPNPLVPGTTPTVSVTASAAGTLDYFFDFDGSGVFGDVAGEAFTYAHPGGTRSVSVAVPAGAALGGTYARFRLSTAGGLGPAGAALDGEVEDYQVVIGEAEPLGLDWGDAPDRFQPGMGPGDYQTLSADGGPSHVITGPRLGAYVDAESDGQQSILADGDDANGVPDDEDGVTITGTPGGSFLLTDGGGATIQVDAQNLPPAVTTYIRGWIDFDGDGVFETNGIEDFGSDITADGMVPLSVTVPAGASAATGGVTWARIRISTAAMGPTGAASDGEVEDYRLRIQPEAATYDFGDAPDPPYGTLLTSGGAQPTGLGP